MDRASEAILALRPVSFRYKKEIDPQGMREFGLIAEEVEKVMTWWSAIKKENPIASATTR